MSHTPRLSVGLPVYNGEKYLHESLDALLGQSFDDFELVVSDNASTDGTEELCRSYAARDSRIRYIRQARNIGAAPNHNVVFLESRGELFKWASCDDLYGYDLLGRCVQELDDHPEAVLSHAFYGIVNDRDPFARVMPYPLATDARRAPDRFRSLLYDVGGEDGYGIIRSNILRRTPLHGSFHPIAERPLLAGLSLYGPFRQVPECLAFRRHHSNRVGAVSTKREQCAIRDPRRANRLRHPAARMHAEYVWAYFAGVHRAPLTLAEKRECTRILLGYLGSRVGPATFRAAASSPPEIAADSPIVELGSVVAGHHRARS